MCVCVEWVEDVCVYVCVCVCVEWVDDVCVCVCVCDMSNNKCSHTQGYTMATTIHKATPN